MEFQEVKRIRNLRLCKRNRGRQTHIPLYFLIREPEGRIIAEFRRIDRATKALSALA